MLKAHNTASGAGSGTAVGPGAVIHRADFICVPVYKWELESIAWFVMIAGGATAAVGGFIDATIVGLPVGAVLNAVGIGTGLSGSALLWWADTYYEDGSATVCFWS
ncbi:hypothetical protein OOZ51_22295 [Arthrobacter sp. MI7-26]|uniref:hypothetical protein n=1 Tax=Arthrobacter sp. MI7-26 TaxID=2993653 RepID=UPI0022489C48|nr:hypothetical protein [Arthrobacter sp. MI7-26]MCX2750509.1 hypothetical protein [Arthrobacter sp. MI7-26]